MTTSEFSGIYQGMNSDVNKKNSNTSNQPIYLRARDILVAQIENGQLKPHDALPSERLLADQLEISRMTARQALNEVEKLGFAYRIGKQGRYVIGQRLSYDVGSSLSFATQALRKSMDLTIDVISTNTESVDASVASLLSVEEGRLVHIYKRIFKSSGRTLLVEKEIAIADRFPGLLEQDLSQPSTLLHENRYGVFGAQAEVKMRCIKISNEDRMFFQKETAPYGMELESIIFDEKGVPFCYGHQVWNSEAADFTLVSKPN